MKVEARNGSNRRLRGDTAFQVGELEVRDEGRGVRCAWEINPELLGLSTIETSKQNSQRVFTLTVKGSHQMH